MKSSPLNELTAQDIARKKIKLGNIEGKLKNTDLSPKKKQRLEEKHHKTKYQIDTGKRGRPTSLRNEEWLAGTSRKSSSPVNNLTEGDEIVSSAEGSANYRKSALNMLGVSPLNNDDDFDVDYSGAKPVDLGSIKSTKRGKKIKAIKDDVSETDDDGLVLKSQHNYFVANPTEESDNMAVKIQDAKTKTLSGGGGKHYKEVEKPLQEELKRKMRNK